MFMNLVKKCYRRLPIIRELMHIREATSQARDTAMLIRECAAGEGLCATDRASDEHVPHGRGNSPAGPRTRCNPRYADPRRLQRYAFQVCSQNGEDGIIREIFRRLGTTDRSSWRLASVTDRRTIRHFCCRKAGRAIGSTAATASSR